MSLLPRRNQLVYDDIEHKVLALRLDALVMYTFNRILNNVGELYVGAVKDFVISAFERHCSCSKAMVLGYQFLHYEWVVESL